MARNFLSIIQPAKVSDVDAAERRRALAESLYARSLEGHAPRSHGRVATAYSPWTALVDVLSTSLAGRNMQKAEQGLSEARNAEEKKVAQAIADYKTSVPDAEYGSTVMSNLRYRQPDADGLMPTVMSQSDAADALAGSVPNGRKALAAALVERHVRETDPSEIADREYKKTQADALLHEKEQARLQRLTELEMRLAATKENSQERNALLREIALIRADALKKNKNTGLPPGLKLKPGEMWDEESQSVRAMEGSDLYQKQKASYTEKTQGVQGAIAQGEDILNQINRVLSPERKDAFNKNFGGYNALLSQYVPGDDVADVRNTLKTVKANMKNLGLSLLRQGGSIGSITQQEWPLMESIIATIDPTLGEEDARAKLGSLAGQFSASMQRVKEAWESEMSNSQYATEAGAIVAPELPPGIAGRVAPPAGGAIGTPGVPGAGRPSAGPAPPAAPRVNAAAALNEARMAVQAGLPVEEARRRLRAAGIDPAGL